MKLRGVRMLKCPKRFICETRDRLLLETLGQIVEGWDGKWIKIKETNQTKGGKITKW